VPTSNAKLTLQNSASGVSYTTTSGEDGGFAFEDMPSGTYALQVEYGNEGSRDYDSIVIKVDPTAAANAIFLTRKQSPEGGTYLSIY
jgi:hypothetical protein